MEVDDDYKMLAQLFIRLDVEEIIHTREVFSFMDFLGDLGGVTEILTKTSSFLIGGFLAWNAGLEMMISLYSHNLAKDL